MRIFNLISYHHLFLLFIFITNTMAKVRFYDLELDVPELVWSPNTCKTRYALNVKACVYLLLAHASCY